eukprot:TRINITY_DN12317_c0_g1_i1.p1 TRINITY_DN12317_c0_g1~~TRINITY_DN12317_c0_g1_i1.p1  ORF type:complete len:314 (-),score=56.04 TRINITY_DN12317_c0_g1_i1:115-963(-)
MSGLASNALCAAPGSCSELHSAALTAPPDDAQTDEESAGRPSRMFFEALKIARQARPLVKSQSEAASAALPSAGKGPSAVPVRPTQPKPSCVRRTAAYRPASASAAATGGSPDGARSRVDGDVVLAGVKSGVLRNVVMGAVQPGSGRGAEAAGVADNAVTELSSLEFSFTGDASAYPWPPVLEAACQKRRTKAGEGEVASKEEFADGQDDAAVAPCAQPDAKPLRSCGQRQAEARTFLDPSIRRNHFMQAVQIMRERSGGVADRRSRPQSASAILQSSGPGS